MISPSWQTVLAAAEISWQTVLAAAEIISADGITDVEIESRVLALVDDPMLVRRLIDCIPEAFGLVFAARICAP
jgi:hypothetical protein